MDSYLDTIRRHYPLARTSSDNVDRLFDLLQQRYHLEPKQIMYADSICSDDLNSMEYPARALDMLGPFKMGGLNGFPFTGLTGVGAFAHHVPENGAVFVFYAPHIGITRDGNLGEILRPGQSEPSSCCGAARAALGKLFRGEIRPGDVTELDYQQNQIEQIYLAHAERIRQAAEPLMEATNVMYEAIEQRIDALAARTEYPCRRLILMGGILINADHHAGSCAEVRRLVCVDLPGRTTTDLLGEFRA